MAAFNPQTSQRLALHLKSLIQPGRPLLLTNIHDPPTTSLALSHPKTKALATASFAVAACAGLPDEELDLATNLSAISKIRARMIKEGKHETIPLTADMQDGYGDSLKEAIEGVVKLGVVGCNLEDSKTTGIAEGRAKIDLISADSHVRRIKTALEVAASLGVPDFVVNARTDCVKLGGTVEEAIERGTKYLAAGATTVFVWGGVERGLRDAEVKQIVEGLEGKVNVIFRKSTRDALSIKELGEIGVARISMGPLLWREGMVAMKTEMDRILEGVE
jgi:2-methylisocitrate lyase-like PEP mutase family enzyme